MSYANRDETVEQAAFGEGFEQLNAALQTAAQPYRDIFAAMLTGKRLNEACRLHKQPIQKAMRIFKELKLPLRVHDLRLIYWHRKIAHAS